MAVASTDKAYLMLKKASATGGVGNLGEVKFQFNPDQFTVTKTAAWRNKPGKGAKQASMPEFTGSEPRSMSVDIFLDAAGPPVRNIVADVNLLFSCCTPAAESLTKNRPSPPFVLFGWGSTMQFEAYVQSVSVKYTMFKQDGTPIRATATLDLQGDPEGRRQAEPHVGRTGRAAHPHRGPWRQPGVDRLHGVRRPE